MQAAQAPPVAPAQKLPPLSKRSMVNFYSYLVAIIVAVCGIIIHLYSYILKCDTLDKSKKTLERIGFILLGIALLSSIFMFAD